MFILTYFSLYDIIKEKEENMKSLNDLIWAPESDDICESKHLASSLAISGELCNPITPPTPPQAIVCLNPPINPLTNCSSGGPMIITCNEIMGSCGGGPISPQGATCGTIRPSTGFGCAVEQ